MKRLLLLSIVVTLLGTIAASATEVGEIFASGADCSPGAGLFSSCATNTGTNSLYLSLWPAVDIPDPVSVEAVVAVASTDAALPDWWRMMAGGCRDGSLSIDFGTTGSFTCGSPFDGTTPASELEMCVECGPAPLPNVAYIRARGTASGMLPIEHYGAMSMMRLVIDHAKSSGTGACAGCNRGLCLALMSVRVVDSQGATHEFCGPGSMASWQSGSPSGCTYATIPASPWSSCTYSVVGTERRTWGSLKTIYR